VKLEGMSSDALCAYCGLITEGGQRRDGMHAHQQEKKISAACEPTPKLSWWLDEHAIGFSSRGHFVGVAA
jgi:hypothetical protein